MSLMRNRTSTPLLVIATVIAASLSTAVRAADFVDYQKFLKAKTPALVTIKFVLKVSMGPMMGGEQENESEITGVMIDPTGLILCSNTQLGGFTAIMKRMMGRMAGEISATPTDLKVLIGEEGEELDADLLARDTELDLAWVKIKDPGNKTFDYLDFAKGATCKIGQQIVAIRRLDKFFGRTPAVLDGRIGGITDKPRKLYFPVGGSIAGMGLPVYTPEGQVVGLTVLQAPDEEDTEMNPMAMLSGMFGMQDMMSGLILPAADVAKATKRAMKSIQEEKQE